MTNEEICAWLKAEAEPKFQKFTSGLIPGTDPIIGVRIPKLRTLAKKIAKEDWRGYLEHAACDTYEEIMLQGLVLDQKTFEFCIVKIRHRHQRAHVILTKQCRDILVFVIVAADL